MTGEANIDNVASDGASLARVAVGALGSLGAISAGIALGATNFSIQPIEDLMGEFGFDNPLITKAVELISALVILALFMTFRGAVGPGIVKFGLTLVALTLGAFLITKVIRLLMSFFQSSKKSSS